MNALLSFAAAGMVVLAGGSVARAQYFHGHAHYHRGHIDYHGHWHYPGYYSGYPVIYGSSWYTPVYSDPAVSNPPVVVYPTPVANSTVVVPAGATSLKPNALPPYTGPGITLRLPAEFPGSVYLQIDKREVELKPGTEVVLKDKASHLVEFDRGGDFGAARHELSEGCTRWRSEPGDGRCYPTCPTAARGGTPCRANRRSTPCPRTTHDARSRSAAGG